MATLKLTMDSRRSYKDGRYPIIIRLTENQKSTSISTKIRLSLQEWDNSKARVTKIHPDYKNVNLLLKKKLMELEKKAIGLPVTPDELSPSQVRESLLNQRKTTPLTFLEFANQQIQSLKDQERFGNASVYQTALNRLMKYTGERATLNSIDYKVISGFETQLLKEGVSRNTIASYMREIRAILNSAIKNGLLERANYAFCNFRIKTEKTVSRAITKDDLEKIRLHPLVPENKLWHSRNIFFLIFNLIGISFIDLALLTGDSIQNGRIVYRRRKTGKIYSIKISPEAEKLINFYRNEKSKYLISSFNLDSVSKPDEIEVIHQKLKVCNKYLKDLGKLLSLSIPLTTYVARYSWANIAKASGYSKDLIAEALGHEYGNSITGIYLESYGDSVIDGVNEKVTEFQSDLLQ